MNIQDITGPIDFQLFMETIWEMATRPTADGIELGQHPQYHIYHNAITVAKLVGMRRTGDAILDGQAAHAYRFPDDDTCSVIIANDGGALKVSVHRPTA
jgi:hypothetical protein